MPIRRKTAYLNEDGSSPQPPEGGWLSEVSVNHPLGQQLVQLFESGIVDRVSSLFCPTGFVYYSTCN